MSDIREKMRALRPDVVRRQQANREKRASALELMDLRWDAAMSDADVARVSGLPLETVRRLESLAGPLPSSEDVARYRAACRAA